MTDLLVENERLRAENAQLRAQLDTERSEKHDLLVRLTAELAILRRRAYGQKAERLKNESAQQSFVDILRELGLLKAGDLQAGERAETLIADLRDEVESPPEKKRGKKRHQHGRRKPTETNVPVERIVLEPPERSMPGGEKLQKIGEETTAYLEHRPASIVRVEVVRPKYLRPEDARTSASTILAASEGGEQPAAPVTVLVADLPALPIPKGLAGPALLAHVLVMKYADHLPLHRMERMFRRDGVHLPRSTLCGFVQGAVALLGHIVAAMWRDARANSPLILTDACGVLVRAKERCHRGAFQVFIAPGRHVFFAYLRQNNGAAVAALLEGFSGKLQSDASSIYHEVFRRQPGIVEVGCWAHARRHLYDALGSARGLALIGIGFIRQLYDAHDAATNKDTGRVDGQKRRALAEPVLASLKAWVASERPRCVPSSPIESALGYLQRQWEPLTRFLDDGSLRLDNNPSELELRHQKVGENNWLFCANDAGAQWNAVVVSLIASCRMHAVEPYAYLRDVLSLLPEWPHTRVLELAPTNWKQTSQRPELLDQLQRLQPLRPAATHVPGDTRSAGA